MHREFISVRRRSWHSIGFSRRVTFESTPSSASVVFTIGPILSMKRCACISGHLAERANIKRRRKATSNFTPLNRSAKRVKLFHRRKKNRRNIVKAQNSRSLICSYGLVPFAVAVTFFSGRAECRQQKSAVGPTKLQLPCGVRGRSPDFMP